MNDYNTNFIYTKHPLAAGTHYSCPIETWHAEEMTVQFSAEGLTGSPTTANITTKFQISPLEYGGFNLDWEPNGNQRNWFDVTAADANLGGLLETDWPATIANETLVSPVIVTRSINLKIPALVRIKTDITFTGGTTPSFDVSAMMLIRS